MKNKGITIKEHMRQNKKKNPKAWYKVQADLRHKLAMAIEDLRISRGWTQEKMAAKIGTSQPSIARAESERVMPTLTWLAKICQATNTRIHIEFKDDKI